ncbi:hypothetical protein EXE55_20475 [Burkholderia glumae]|uniref:hypothetical protein n=1 Tax=Burkholderia glumae TaxID=337 RepID=UPI001373B04E|nr:hypothetical protein [Burkholderia glumae]MCR1771003.1 hypothetical protein [Burkholderia glumae]QHP93295.1 hypothetical protein EXE55_20475 [Burkholderia glumae]
MSERRIITALTTALVLFVGCAPNVYAKYDAAEKAVKSALANNQEIDFSDLYENTPDLHGISQTSNYKRTFICGYVTYKKQDGKPVRVRFIYAAHLEDPSHAEYGPLNLESPELNYGIRDENNEGRYATAFEFSGWNRVCSNSRHPKTFSGVAPKSDD